RRNVTDADIRGTGNRHHDREALAGESELQITRPLAEHLEFHDVLDDGRSMMWVHDPVPLAVQTASSGSWFRERREPTVVSSLPCSFLGVAARDALRLLRPPEPSAHPGRRQGHPPNWTSAR